MIEWKTYLIFTLLFAVFGLMLGSALYYARNNMLNGKAARSKCYPYAYVINFIHDGKLYAVCGAEKEMIIKEVK